MSNFLALAFTVSNWYSQGNLYSVILSTRDLPRVALVITFFHNTFHSSQRVVFMLWFPLHWFLFQGEGTYPKKLDLKTFPISSSNRGHQSCIGQKCRLSKKSWFVWKRLQKYYIRHEECVNFSWSLIYRQIWLFPVLICVLALDLLGGFWKDQEKDQLLYKTS